VGTRQFGIKLSVQEALAAPRLRRRSHSSADCSVALRDHLRTVVNRNGGAGHGNARAPPVLDIDPAVIDDDNRAPRALEHDAAGGAR
jgi:hypothetical protein